MEILETIDDILDQEDYILSKDDNHIIDEKLFDRMANFIINLEPANLDDNQVQEVINIIDDIEDDDLIEVRTPKLAKRTLATKNQYSKKWYRKNRNKIKRRKAKLARSSQGRKRMKAKVRLARQGKTATGRKKVRYHVRKRSKRKDRLKEKGDEKK